jgi:hypothetical protein
VLGSDGKILASASALEARFSEIAQDAASQPISGCVGAISTGGRTEWAAARARLASASTMNAANLKTVDEALFLVCLDSVRDI